MKLLSGLTPPSIYHCFFTWKTFWVEKFTGEEIFTLGEFIPVNMKNYGRLNVRKHREIKDSDKYITLYISLNFENMDKIKITSLEAKDNLRR